MSASMVLLTSDYHRWYGGSRDHVKHGRRMLHVRNSAFLFKNVKILPSLSFCQDFAHSGVDFSSFSLSFVTWSKDRSWVRPSHHRLLAQFWMKAHQHSTAQLKTSEEAIKPSSPCETVAFLLPRLKWCLIDSPCQWTRRLVMRCINECVGRD